ncbi:hypothetical protein TNCV_3903021 [Trichonephila clavipes]|nr:hypothetical protein TNCV_3903021 [Trichonephila clavipes]
MMVDFSDIVAQEVDPWSFPYEKVSGLQATDRRTRSRSLLRPVNLEAPHVSACDSRESRKALLPLSITDKGRAFQAVVALR